MKTSSKLAIVAIAVALMGCDKKTNTTPLASSSDAKTAQLQAKFEEITKQEEADARLGQYIVNMMFKSPETVRELSPAMMNMLARNIVRDTGDVMGNEVMMKQFFIGAVQLESKFLRFSQSPTGPKGLSQTTKATFHNALKFCGINEVHDNDVWDTDLSIIAGACYYKWLYSSYRDGYYTDNSGHATSRKICPDTPQQPVLKEICAGQHASVAYNQGESSKAIKSFLKSGVLSEIEPAIYNGKVIFNVTTTPTGPMPGVPLISQLPKANSLKVIKKASAKK